MNGKILVVEDDPPTRQLLKLWLSGEGFEVQFAADENATLEFIAQWKPDAVLLDILLPAPVGFDICREAKKVSNVPVMLMTARTLDSDRRTAYEAGADDFMQKPFDWTDLMERVQSLVHRNGDDCVSAMATA